MALVPTMRTFIDIISFKRFIQKPKCLYSVRSMLQMVLKKKQVQTHTSAQINTNHQQHKWCGLSPKARSISAPSQSQTQLLTKQMISVNFVLCSGAPVVSRMLHNANQRPHFLLKTQVHHSRSQVPLQVPNVHSLSFSVCLSPWPWKCRLCFRLFSCSWCSGRLSIVYCGFHSQTAPHFVSMCGFSSVYCTTMLCVPGLVWI